MDIYAPVKRALKKAVKAKDYALSIPPDPKLGDVSSAVAFSLSKKNPAETAKKIASKIKASGIIKEVRAVGPYINFFFDRDKFGKKVIKEHLKILPRKKRGKTICLDIYSPNMMKGLHLGHLRNAASGGCLYRILAYDGYDVKAVSFGSDVGLPIAKVVWGYMNLGLKPEGIKGEWLGTIYALANRMFEKDPRVRAEVYEINKKIYDKDERIMRIYNTLIKWSVEYVKDMAKRLRLKINKFINESDAVKPALKAINLLKKKGIAEESNGALIVNLEKYGLGVYVLLTSQGVPTYEAKDIGLAFIKDRLFHPDKNVIYTGEEQVNHFRQVIKTLELMGFKKGSIIHKPYGLVLSSGKKLSSRKGASLMISSVMDDMKDAALLEVTRKNPSLSEKERERIAGEIALSSIFYGMIKQDLNKTINFNPDEWVKFDGDTGAYIQYSYVRAWKIRGNGRFRGITHDAEYALIKKINEFSGVIDESVKKLDSSLIARYSHELALLFNKFYEACPVMKGEVNESRVAIVNAYLNVMGECMRLMGMKPLKRM